jgi:hypothetical protein
MARNIPLDEASSPASSSLINTFWHLYQHALFPVLQPLSTFRIAIQSPTMVSFGGKKWTPNDIPDLAGKVFLVTGG